MLGLWWRKKRMHVTNHKLGMIISVICSYIGAALMVKEDSIKGKAFCFKSANQHITQLLV